MIQILKLNKSLIIFTILLLLGLQSAYSKSQIEISLLTCSSGAETFTAWGHSAIRIIDPESNTDIVYNFGLFDFDTPNFYPKFIKGKLKYKLGVHDTYHFYTSYFEENRQIIEQKLNLSDENKTKIISRLKYLYKPENRYYLYSFVGKNCTSELRDLILENVETNFDNTITQKSYRDQLHEFLNDKLWMKFGMSLIMGYKIDRNINKFESLFLPDYLCAGLNDLQTNNQPLVEKEQVYNKVDDSGNAYPFLINPILIFSLILVLIVLIKSNFVQIPLQIIIGLLGLVILVVSLYTEHPELQYNLNLLWINPFYIFTAFKFKNYPNIRKYLTLFIQALIIIMIPIWIFHVQQFELTFLLICSVLTIFNIRILAALKKN
ncbi:MAG: DUF4105 domain-containing protein [Bacteroidales bacterium]|nr:DUF4105 domain-containing protein [Bacteroidales bacterium]